MTDIPTFHELARHWERTPPTAADKRDLLCWIAAKRLGIPFKPEEFTRDFIHV
jgi:hypothetical protein